MADKEATRTVTVLNYGGLHLRAVSLLSNLAQAFDSAISVVRRNHVVDGKSMLQLMTLGADQGEVIVLKAVGPDADEALDVLADLFATRFGSDAEDQPEPEHQDRPAEEEMTEDGR